MSKSPAFKRSHALLKFIAFIILVFIVFFTIIINYFQQQLPDVEVLKNIQMQIPLRVYSADGQLIAEFGEKRRIPISLKDVPKPLIEALLATEDQRYYENPGVDFWGLFRAARELIITGKKVQGGSTITMQVARNFFLTGDKTFNRKIREILLALKISRELNKDQVLELYLNGVYLGRRAYGVGAAAQIYYGKSLEQLTLAEMAMIAGLPKAPSTINPLVNPKAAKERRTHVLERMLELNYINQKQFNAANKEPLMATYHGIVTTLYAPYVAEAVRNQMVDQYGDEAYTIGLKVYTTINDNLQKAANNSVRRAVLNYDQRHGYRGAIMNWGSFDGIHLFSWKTRLSDISSVYDLQPAAILTVEGKQATALISTGDTVTIPWTGLSWAKRQLANGLLGATPSQASDVMKVGDIVYLRKMGDTWRLSQIPSIQAALVSLNPQTGATLALVGGFNFNQSSFNRVYQAKRQVGSSFKPFIYSAALDKGLTLSTIVNDAPFVATGVDANTNWRPENDDLQFMGPIRLRVALMRSRNLATVRVLQNIGIDYTLNYLNRFGFDSKLFSHDLTLALGSSDLTPIQMADAFSVFANGGYKINNYLIDHVEDNKGKVLYQSQPLQACEPCITAPANALLPTIITNPAPRVISPQIAYLITSGLQSVIQGGTGRAAQVLNRSDLAGKTGTTNDQTDAWFDGFNSDILTVVWMGFDQPQSTYAYGAEIALPLWIDFMRVALQNKPMHTMQRPAGLVTVKINPVTGEVAPPGETNAIFETFLAGTEPASLKSNELKSSAYSGVYSL